jgi:magnesium and cobalt exporter, CNNM family
LEGYSLSSQLVILGILLVVSAFFSIAETSMMALNRFRLRAMVRLGNHAARRASILLARTDRLLGVILLGNNLVNAAAATLTGVVTLEFFGHERFALALGTLAVTFAILVFSEITPKVVGAAYAERIALPLAYVLGPLLRLLYPVVWFINLFVTGLLRILHIPTSGHEVRLSPEELRALVLEHSRYLPKRHQTILSNLFDLEHLTVNDIMVPRARIEGLDLDLPDDQLQRQLATSHHTRLVAYRGEPGNVVGLIHMRRVLAAWRDGAFDKESLAAMVRPPYFVPASTPVLAQLQYFQEMRERVALVVDEYGELLGLVTLEDILEEFIGEFTTGSATQAESIAWDASGSVLVEGAVSLRELNRKLGLQLPLDGPKTLNGLIVEHLQDIPESGVSVKLAGVVMEITQTEDRAVKTVRLFRPQADTAEQARLKEPG